MSQGAISIITGCVDRTKTEVARRYSHQDKRLDDLKLSMRKYALWYEAEVRKLQGATTGAKAGKPKDLIQDLDRNLFQSASADDYHIDFVRVCPRSSGG